MTAAVKSETFVSGVGLNKQTTGTNMKVASYTVTLATTKDWIVASEFTTVTNVYAEIVADGVHNEVLITSGNTLTFQGATVGAHRLVVWGY